MPDKDLTGLLAAAHQGRAGSKDELWEVVYAELRALARSQAARNRLGPARQPTSLVHEAFLRLARDDGPPGADGREFFAAAARAMRDVQVDDARHRGRLKRGGGRKRVPLKDEARVGHGDPVQALALVEALGRLERMDARKSEIVTLRCFGSMTLAETAQALGVSVRTVASEWRFARAWLRRELEEWDTLPQREGIDGQ